MSVVQLVIVELISLPCKTSASSVNQQILPTIFVQVKSASLPNPGGSGGGVSDGQTQQPGLLNKENSEPRLDVSVALLCCYCSGRFALG